MSRRLQVVTADFDAVPQRHWHLSHTGVHDMGETYRYEQCGRCTKPVADHLWFVIDLDLDTVTDCSEEPAT